MAAAAHDAQGALARALLQEYPDDAARVVEGGDDRESAELLGREGADASLGLMQRLTPDRAARILALLPPEILRRTTSGMNPNRTAGLLARLDTEERDRCLEVLDESLAAELRELSSYPPETAGALMDPRVTSFRPDATVRDVTRRMRRFRTRRISDVFVVDSEAKLLGSISLETIVLSKPTTRLDGLLESPVVSVQSISSRDEIVETFESHRISSLPVVDFEGRLLGVLRSAVTDPEAGRMLGVLFTRQGPVQLLRAMGSNDPDLRAELVGTQLVGLAIARHVLRVEPLASADHETIVAAVGPTMQRYLAGDLGLMAGS